MSMGSKEDSGIGMISKVSKVAKIRNRYNQVPHLTQDCLCLFRVRLPCAVCTDITSDLLSDWWITFTVSK